MSGSADATGFGKVLDDAKGGLLDDERIFLFDASDLLRVRFFPKTSQLGVLELKPHQGCRKGGFVRQCWS